MAGIQIDYAGVSEANTVLQCVLQELETMEGMLATIRQAVPSEVRMQCEIEEKLSLCCHSAEMLREQVQRLLRTVEAGSRSYQDLDERIARMAPNHSSTNIKG